MRVNILSGAGAGKSTLASYIFNQLKIKGYSIELVSEWIKPWAYHNRKLNRFDQYKIFGEQHHSEYQYLSAGVSNIVTDSPVFLSYIYPYSAGDYKIAQALLDLCLEYEQDFPSVNILLDRSDNSYDENGRWQTLDQAKQFDALIEARVRLYFDSNTYKFRYDDYESIMELVEKKIHL